MPPVELDEAFTVVVLDYEILPVVQIFINMIQIVK